MLHFHVCRSALITLSQLQIYTYFLIIKNINPLFCTQNPFQPPLFRRHIPKYGICTAQIYPHLAIVQLCAMLYLCSVKI